MIVAGIESKNGANSATKRERLSINDWKTSSFGFEAYFRPLKS
jgi:hypothetical protein